MGYFDVPKKPGIYTVLFFANATDYLGGASMVHAFKVLPPT